MEQCLTLAYEAERVCIAAVEQATRDAMLPNYGVGFIWGFIIGAICLSWVASKREQKMEEERNRLVDLLAASRRAAQQEQ